MINTADNKRGTVALINGLKLITSEAKSLDDKRKQCTSIDEVRHTCPRDIPIVLTPDANDKRIGSFADEAFRILAAQLSKL